MAPTARPCRTVDAADAEYDGTVTTVAGGCASRRRLGRARADAGAGEPASRRQRGDGSFHALPSDTVARQVKITRTFADFGQHGRQRPAGLQLRRLAERRARDRAASTHDRAGQRRGDAHARRAPPTRRRSCSVEPRSAPRRARATRAPPRPEREVLARRRRRSSSPSTAPAANDADDRAEDRRRRRAQRDGQRPRTTGKPRRSASRSRRTDAGTGLASAIVQLDDYAPHRVPFAGGTNCADLTPDRDDHRPADGRGLPDRRHGHDRARHVRRRNDPERHCTACASASGTSAAATPSCATSSIAGADKRPVVNINNNPFYGSPTADLNISTGATNTPTGPTTTTATTAASPARRPRPAARRACRWSWPRSRCASPRAARSCAPTSATASRAA